jgi:hypothetical protein
MGLTRPDDWPERLAAFLAARHVPFAWGSQDCVSLAADWVMALGLDDPIAPFRGYTDARSAVLAIRAAGGISSYWATALPETPIGMARRGDLGVIHIGRREATVIVTGGELVGAGAQGLVTLPRSRLVRAFEVG